MNCAEPRWEHFAHEADMGVRGHGPDAASAFAQAALALTAVVCDPGRIRAQEARTFRCEAPDLELLLVDWLNALVWAMAVENLLFAQFEVRIEGFRLEAMARGEKIDPARHQPAVEVKGATLTELQVRCQPDGTWLAQCVVDV